MGNRLKLQALLEETVGNSNVWFKPPQNVRLSYPATIYNLSAIPVDRADNLAYILRHRYTMTYITTNPDDKNIDKLALLPYCKFIRSYTADGLLHNIYEIEY